MIVRDVVEARGADARSYLHSQLSNDISSLAPGSSCYSFILEPNGKLSALVRVRCVADDHFVVDTDEGRGTATTERLERFKIRVKCDFVQSRCGVVALRGLDAEGRAAMLRLRGAVSAWRATDGAVDLFEVDDQNPDVAGVDPAAHEVERVRRAWPAFGVDIDGDTIPAETSLVDVCVSFTKGCYPGQELVERMDSRASRAPRSLMRLSARPDDSGARAVAGEPYVVDGQEIGRCTSVAGEFALVMVARAHVDRVRATTNP